MPKYAEIGPGKPWLDSLRELTDEFRKWGIEDYILPTKSESLATGHVTVRFAPRGDWIELPCSRWTSGHDPRAAEKNLQAILLAIRSARLADQRGIGGLFARALEHLALTDGTNHDDPYSILGVSQGATQEELWSAYRRKLR